MKHIHVVFFCFFSAAASAHDFASTDGSDYVIESFTLSGEQIWVYYFSSDAVRLMRRIGPPSQQEMVFINHPQYVAQFHPHRLMVCENYTDRLESCNSDFEHVHFDDFMMGKSVAEELCSSFGADVLAQFQSPLPFVEVDEHKPATSHHDYVLELGLTFDCVME